MCYRFRWFIPLRAIQLIRATVRGYNLGTMAMNLSDTIRRKQQRILELRQEIAALQAELKDARSMLSGKRQNRALLAIAERPRILTHSVSKPRQPRTRAIKHGSTVWWAERLLKTWKHDEHIDVIVSEIERATGKPVSKPTVVSNLSRYVSKGDTFTRPAESRYGLIDYGDEVKAG